ncbi:hypothetical protein [Acidithiobacillus ferriphilus]|uniref:hypothetical protein n=1 Tax=Acidithiobacillus ferriphilus TaxID=1689834 RepID=UPI004055E56D
MSAAYNSAQNYGGYSEGYINVDSNPTQSTGQWDYQPAAAAATETNPNHAQGRIRPGITADADQRGAGANQPCIPAQTC